MVKAPTLLDRCVSCGDRLALDALGLVLLDNFYCESCSRSLIYPALAGDSQLLAAQYSQVNERSRWYSAAMWQVPTATLFGLAVAVSFVVEIDEERIRGLMFLVLAATDLLIVNAFILWSTLAAKATRHIREMEVLLGLFPTALDAKEARRAAWLPVLPVDQFVLFAVLLLLIAVGLGTFGLFEVATGR